ncbi:hypothetical protein [Sphingobacterium psychroaquaticum]|uniref:Uncharacterized protein n=1 Tax=Sphingobacterium psychroaquaticum TaxID=561061 RepID=A0A1X7IM86_9SPHI|nr:hypothetical protein [Sphingobacterium psychroaquaticum]SMG15716.1 hypothetical protein SAMN05660862_0995 [Sphingobacterium psychroaquaticum]
MKKLSLKSKLLLGAILMGGTIAGAHTISKVPSANEATYDWASEPNSPKNPGQSLLDRTVDEAVDHFGCEGVTNLCATGTPINPEDDEVTINFN